VEIFEALLMFILVFKEQTVLITLGIQDKDSPCTSRDIHQCVSCLLLLYALFCFPVMECFWENVPVVEKTVRGYRRNVLAFPHKQR